MSGRAFGSSERLRVSSPQHRSGLWTCKEDPKCSSSEHATPLQRVLQPSDTATGLWGSPAAPPIPPTTPTPAPANSAATARKSARRGWRALGSLRCPCWTTPRMWLGPTRGMALGGSPARVTPRSSPGPARSRGRARPSARPTASRRSWSCRRLRSQSSSRTARWYRPRRSAGRPRPPGA